MVEVKNTHKIPLEGQLPEPEKRVFDNSFHEKPARKIAKLDVKFGEVNIKNYEQLRIINYLTLPVVYSEQFYEFLLNMRRYSRLAYVKDVLVGAISCKEDIDKDTEEHVCYIMTITVLPAYKRYGIGSQMLEQVIEDCVTKRKVKKMRLHVQAGNDAALQFYKKHGFEVKEELKGYYTELDPSDCFLLEKVM